MAPPDDGQKHEMKIQDSTRSPNSDNAALSGPQAQLEVRGHTQNPQGHSSANG